jgi:hypothetical protein
VEPVPSAPWELGGELMAALVRDRGSLAPVPDPLRRLPGPCLVVAVRYEASPVGPYLELAVAEPARLGGRPGLFVSTMVVDHPGSRLAGRLNWGYPKELGTLRWSADGEVTELVWEERGIVVSAVASRRALPVLVPVRTLQRRSDGPVVVPGRLRGRARPARVMVKVPGGDELEGLDGDHRGAVVAGMRFVLHPARHPVGRTSSLRAPLRAPEPALWLGPNGGD